MPTQATVPLTHCTCTQAHNQSSHTHTHTHSHTHTLTHSHTHTLTHSHTHTHAQSPHYRIYPFPFSRPRSSAQPRHTHSRTPRHTHCTKTPPAAPPDLEARTRSIVARFLISLIFQLVRFHLACREDARATAHPGRSQPHQYRGVASRGSFKLVAVS
jgi:hypothetical protein